MNTWITYDEFIYKLKIKLKMTRKVKVGDIILVTGNEGSANYTVGEKYRVTQIDLKALQAETLDGSWKGNWLRLLDAKVVGITREDYQKYIDEYQAKIDEAKAIVAWMDEAGVTEFDEDEFNVWQALTTIENGSMSKMNKVKAIAALLKK
jgi:uncharacterized Zn finger protein